MPRLLLVALWALLAATAARAAEPPPACPNTLGTLWSAEQLFGITADWPRAATGPTTAPHEFPMKPERKGVAGRETFRVTLSDIPNGATFFAAARERPRARWSDRLEYEGSRASVESIKAGQVTLRLEAPRNRTGWFDERWLVVVAVCGPDGRLAGYGLTEMAVNPRNLSRLAAAALILVVYLAAGVAAWQCNARRLHARWTRIAEDRGIAAEAGPRRTDAADLAGGAAAAWRQRMRWKLRYALDPVFITQDAGGHGSLGRLQLFLFSLAVGFVALNIFFATGSVAELSEDVLWLLGISVLAAGTSRLVPTNSGLSAASRQWIAARRILRPAAARLPLWRDIISADGEIDVTRVQAVIFTLLTAFALVVSGAGDLSTFSVSDEVQYLLGLSQITYIAGKAIPTESVKRLNDAITAIRAAEALPDTAPDKETRFRDAKVAAGQVLLEVYGRGFRAEDFETLQPGQALPALPDDVVAD